MIKALRIERAKLITDARAIMDTKGATDEDLARATAMLDDADKKLAHITSLERAQAMEAGLAEQRQTTALETGRSVDEVVATVEREKRLFRAMLLGTSGRVSPEDRQEVAQRYGQIDNAASTGTSTAGGYTIAPAFMADLLVAMKAQGGMRTVARGIQTDTGVNLPWPTMDDRSQVASIVGENTQLGTATDLVFGSNTLTGYTYTSNVLLVSLQMLQDSAFDFDSLIRNALAGRFVRGQNAHFTTGTGTGQPQGAVTGAASGVVGATGSTTSATFDNILDLIHSVDPVYRPGSRFMFHDTTLQMLRKLKDTTGRYLWQIQEAGTAGGPPGDTIWGYPVTINQDMPVLAANAKSILFGNFDSYIIRDILGMQLMVLRERYADYLQVGYIGFMRTDGRLITAAQPIKYYQNSAT